MAGEIQRFVSDAAADSSGNGRQSKFRKNAIGLAAGTLFFISSLLVLIWNEGCSLEAMRRLNPVLALKPVEVSGSISTGEVLSDEVFYVSVKAARLIRVVEMYQWKEDTLTRVHNKPDGSIDTQKDATYHKDWSESPISSASFRSPEGHANPDMPYRSTEYSASVAKVGGVTLSPQVIEQIAGAEDYPMTADSFAKINPDLTGFRLSGDAYYRGGNPDEPAIGDVRVRFRAVLAGDHVNVSGRLKDGRLDVMNAVAQEPVTHNTAMTWGFRLGGWLAMFTGLMLVFVSLQLYGRRLPVLGSMAAFGMKLIAMVMATALTLITIATIWFAHSPAISMVLLMVASGVIIASTFVMPKARPPIPASVKYIKVPHRNLNLNLNQVTSHTLVKIQ